MPDRKTKVARQSVPLPDRHSKDKTGVARALGGSSAEGSLLAARRAASGTSEPGQPLLRLQRNVGNHSVQQMLAHNGSMRHRDGQVQPKLIVSRTGDRFEQEANQVARAIAIRDGRADQRAAKEDTVHRQAQEEDKKTAQMQMEENEKTVQEQPEEEKKKSPV